MLAEAALALALSRVVLPHDTMCTKQFIFSGQPRAMALYLCHGVPLPPNFYEEYEKAKQDWLKKLQQKEERKVM